MPDCLLLTFTQRQTGDYLFRQPIPPQRCDEVRAALPEVGLGQAGFKAIGDHIGRAGSGLLDILHTKEWFGNQGIARDGSVGLSQQFGSQAGRQLSGIPDFDAIRKDDDLDKSVVAVVSVSDGIDNRLSNGRAGNLELDRGLCALCSCANTTVEFSEDKLNGLVNHLEQSSIIRLLGGDGLLFLCSMEMKTMNLSVVEKSTWVLSEKQHRGIGGFAIPKQVEVLQHRLRSAGTLERQPPLSAWWPMTYFLPRFSALMTMSVIEYRR